MFALDTISLVLVIIGGLNWASVGLFRVDFIASIFGNSATAGSRIVYTLVGIAALWSITLLFKNKTPARHHED